MGFHSVDLVPPQELITGYAGGMSSTDFINGGEQAVSLTLVGRADLQPSSRILDIGCGCGRIARPLTRYLRPEGRYDGIDVGPQAIEWCRTAYAGFPNFHFHHADLRSTCYNPDGADDAAGYRLPFEADAFDCVFLGSVFTHMLPDQVAQYLREIARVMKPAGICLATFYLLDDGSRANNDAGRTEPQFAHELVGGCRIRYPSMPEDAVAYEEHLARRLYADSGLVITEIGHGQWGRGALRPHMQDAVWARRAA